MAAILLDTTVLIDLLRGRAGAVRRLADLRHAGDRPYVCAVNVEEIERGIRDGVEVDAAQRLLDGMNVAPLGRPEGMQAGRWRREFATRGRTLSQADCLVAAAAIAVGARLATGNPRDFPMAGLAIEEWPVGERS